ncbi:unnamed protein product [Parajaminaea phylloscopi]
MRGCAAAAVTPRSVALSTPTGDVGQASSLSSVLPESLSLPAIQPVALPRMFQVGVHKTDDEAAIGYQIHGGGPATPLVLIMGLSGIQEDWTPLVEELSRTRRVLIFDHRGIGASSVPDEWDHELNYDVMCNDLLSLLRSLGKQWSTIDALGFSMGGHMLQHLITREGTKVNAKGGIDLGAGIGVRRVLLTATMTRLPRGDLDMNKLQEDANKIQDLAQRKVYSVQELLRYQYDERTLADEQWAKERLLLRTHVSLHTSRPQSIIALQFMAISQCRLTEQDLGKVPSSVPVLIIHGQKDRMVHYAESDKMDKWIKHAKRVDLSDGPQGARDGWYGHFWYDYFGADYWAKKIERFLDGPSSREDSGRL